MKNDHNYGVQGHQRQGKMKQGHSFEKMGITGKVGWSKVTNMKRRVITSKVR